MGISKAQSEIFNLSLKNDERIKSGRKDSIWEVKSSVANDIVDMLKREVKSRSYRHHKIDSDIKDELDKLDEYSIERLEEGLEFYEQYCIKMQEREEAMLHASDELRTEKSSSERKKTYRVAIKKVKEASKSFNTHKKVQTKINKYAQEEASILDSAVRGLFYDCKTKSDEDYLKHRDYSLHNLNNQDIVHIESLIKKQKSIDSRVNASKNKFTHNFPSVPTL